MVIYTSYFANYRQFQGCLMVSIARYSPKGFDGFKLICDERFKDIVPSEKLLLDYKEKKITNKEYAIRYID